MQYFHVAAAIALGAPGAIAQTASVAAQYPHGGENLRVTVHRAGASLPAYRVPELLPGDSLTVTADELVGDENRTVRWMRGIALAPGNAYVRVAPADIRIEPLYTDRAVAPLGMRLRAGMRPLVFVAPMRSGEHADRAIRRLRSTISAEAGSLVRATENVQTHARRGFAYDLIRGALRRDTSVLPVTFKGQISMLAAASGVTVGERCYELRDPARVACTLASFDSASGGPSGSLVGKAIAGRLRQADSVRFDRFGPYVAAAWAIGHWISRRIDPGHYLFVGGVPQLPSKDGEPFRLMLPTEPVRRFDSRGPNMTAQMYVPLASVGPRSGPPPRPIATGSITCLAGERPSLPVVLDSAMVGTHFAHGWELRNAQGGTVLRVLDETRDLSLVAENPGRLALAPGRHTFTVRGRWGFETTESDAFTVEVPDPASAIADADTAFIVAGDSFAVHVTGAAPRCVRSVALRYGPHNANVVEALRPPRVIADSSVVSFRLPGSLEGTDARAVIRLVGGDSVMRPVRVQRRLPEIISIRANAQDSLLHLVARRAGTIRSVRIGSSVWANPDEVEPDSILEFHLVQGNTLPVRTGGGPATRAALALTGSREMRNVLVDVLPPRPYAQLQSRSVGRDPHFTLPAGIASERAEVSATIEGARNYRFAQTGIPEVWVRSRDMPGDTARIPSPDYSVPGRIDVVFSARVLFPRGVNGPLEYRVAENGLTTPWSPLDTRVVSMPTVTAVRQVAGAWRVEGQNLDRVQSASGDPAAENFASVQACAGGDPKSCIEVPAPVAGALYMRMRGFPSAVVRLNAEP